ncbi:heavy-metal-associated domain-containing protein [Gaetbulibacter aestuarii]|uniref:Cation transporter n=1 Tax=Gaetbulibacter aestuarii TaxID=1502358 RepID=A0ABW7N210_9FLAO
MKQIFLSVFLVSAMLTSCKNATKENNDKPGTEMASNDVETIHFGVRGNCTMCKATIEKAVNGVDGVEKADWNVDNKEIEVSFNASKTNDMAIHKAIAGVGYDTDKMMADDAAYKDLPMCCQYDHEMKMSLSK